MPNHLIITPLLSLALPSAPPLLPCLVLISFLCELAQWYGRTQLLRQSTDTALLDGGGICCTGIPREVGLRLEG
jgi:hypothetical protein